MYLKANLFFFVLRKSFWQEGDDHQPSNITFIFLSIFFRVLSFMIFSVKGGMYESKLCRFCQEMFFSDLIHGIWVFLNILNILNNGDRMAEVRGFANNFLDIP